jgi:hypothetical protein
MNLTVKTLCLFLALALFAVAALGIGSGRFNLIAAGLFFLTLAQVAG